MILLGLLGTTPTSACSLSAPTGLTIDTSIEDELAPAPPVLIDVVVSRGRGGQADSCADIGTIWITLERPDGDPDSDDEVGYRLLQLDGTLPQGFVLLPYPILGPELYLHWIDEATDEQEAFGFTLELTPVDIAVNEGEPLEVFVSDPGRAAESAAKGCATTPVGSGLFTLAAVAMLMKRRRAN